MNSLLFMITAAVMVKDVQFNQSPRTGNVEITYTLENGESPAWVFMDVLTNGTSIGLCHVQSITGAVSSAEGKAIEPGENLYAEWNPRADWKGNVATNAVVAVNAMYMDRLQDLYVDIDISEGPDAEYYPVSYTFDTPSPTTDYSCASNHIILKYCPAGTFDMGKTDDDTGTTYRDTEPKHTVTLTRPFAIGVFEVTRSQYNLVMGEDAAPSNGISSGTLTPVNNIHWGILHGGEAQTYAENTFIAKLRAKTGLSRINLPTEAQWEYAARAGHSTTWGDGSSWTTDDNDPAMAAMGWFTYNSVGKMHPVGQKKPNSWGLYDMHGNAGEWVLDYYVETKTASAATDPLYTTKTGFGTVKGGSNSGRAIYDRPAYHPKYPLTTRSNGYGDAGFRIAISYLP